VRREPESFLFDGPADAPVTVVLAHGAGAPMDSPFMSRAARDLADVGLRVARFEFPYMAGRRAGVKRPYPDREPVLRTSWLEAIAHCGGAERVVIGGKSLGGRIASMVADEAGVRGVDCLGYPFHPPGRPDRLRTVHLETLRTPALIVQGTRDPFGTREEVQEYRLSDRVRIYWIEGGDHSWKPPARSGRTEAENFAEGMRAVRAFAANPTGPN
jgi:predicted alpha/beta-hydrolase family hydrolase